VRGLGKFRNVSMRQNIYKTKGFTIIDDCYNANPDSMTAALSVLKSVGTEGRRIAVLGDMLELGAYSEEAHLRLGAESARAADYILLFGAESERTLLGAIRSGKDSSEIQHFETREELVQELRELAKPGDVILFKGSRGMKLEQARELFLGEKEQ
jgi:UDP-N-acetylmuramoyl-tripeptide--D-alanyl-D-alanine ligase